MLENTQDKAAGPLRRAVQHADRLFEISIRLSAEHDPDVLLRFIIETAAEVLDCEAASILLFDEAQQQLRFVASTGSDPEQLAQIPVPLGSSLAGTIFTENRSLLIRDAKQDARHFKQVGEKVAFQTSSLVGVPMCIEGVPVGVLEGLNKKDGSFSESDVEVLSIIAAQAAVAIRNARHLQALEDANKQLSHLDKLKSDFLALASHELRTPLSAIKGYAEILKEEVGPSLAEFADSVLTAAAKMHQVVEAMADMETLRGGGGALDRSRLVLQNLVRKACADAAPIIGEKYHNLKLDLPKVPIRVHVDAKRLRLALTNVLTNAAQFTPSGGHLIVRLGVVHDGACTLEIEDDGIGLPTAEVENIFKDFYQVEDHLTRSHGGLGLGLTVAREIVHRHDGRIWATSDGPGTGTTVALHLPVLA